MRTAKLRNLKNRTIKGGLSMPNTKVHLIVRKSKLQIDKLIYDLVIAKPAFPFITDYAWYNMNAVDEALALIRMKEVPVKDALGNVNKPESDVLYKDTFEYGYNKIDKDDDDYDDDDDDSDYTDDGSSSDHSYDFDNDDEYNRDNKKYRESKNYKPDSDEEDHERQLNANKTKAVLPTRLAFKRENSTVSEKNSNKRKGGGGTKRSKANPSKSNQTRSKRSLKLNKYQR